MKKLVPIFLTTRPAFLVLAPVCVFLGVATANIELEAIHRWYAALATFGALSAHISINTLNEYCDFRSGLDLATKRTPFSGGSGVLPKNPELAGSVRDVGMFAFLATVATGACFVSVIGWGIVPVGLAGLALIASYSSFIVRYPLICLIAPGTGFGILFVVGSAYVISEQINASAIAAGLVTFFLCNNLLLLNQFPDIQADRSVGRRSFPIVYGTKASAYVYGASVLGAFTVIIAAVVGGVFPKTALLAMLSLPLGLVAFRGALSKGPAVAQSPLDLASNVAVAVITPLLLALSFVVD